MHLAFLHLLPLCLPCCCAPHSVAPILSASLSLRFPFTVAMIFQCHATTLASCRHSLGYLLSLSSILLCLCPGAVSLVDLVRTPPLLLLLHLLRLLLMAFHTIPAQHALHFKCLSLASAPPVRRCAQLCFSAFARPISCLEVMPSVARVSQKLSPGLRALPSCLELVCGSVYVEHCSQCGQTFNSADWLQSTIVCSLYNIYFQLGG